MILTDIQRTQAGDLSYPFTARDANPITFESIPMIDYTPLVTNSKLYNVGGALYWSGSNLSAPIMAGAANTFWATPNGAPGVPSLREMVLADFPTIANNTVLGNTSGGAAVPSALTAAVLTGLTAPASTALTLAGGSSGATLTLNTGNGNSTLLAAGSGDIVFQLNSTGDTVIAKNTNGPCRLWSRSFSATGNLASLRIGSSRGTEAAASPTLSGDQIANMYFCGNSSATATAIFSVGANIWVAAQENWGATNWGTQLSFLACPVGSNVSQECLTLSPTYGNRLIGNQAICSVPIANIFNPSYPLDLRSTGLTASTEYLTARFIEYTSLSGVALGYYTTAGGAFQEARIRSFAAGGIPLCIGTTNYPRAIQISNTLGQVSFGDPAGTANTYITIAAAAGYAKAWRLSTGTTFRWGLTCDNTAESGGNAGSTLQLQAFADDGSYLRTILSCDRRAGYPLTTGQIFEVDNTSEASAGNGSINTAGGIYAAKKLICGTSITTGAPTGGTAAAAKHGVKNTSTLVALDTANWLEEERGGVLYRIALITITTP